jgi:hypothetical protein
VEANDIDIDVIKCKLIQLVYLLKYFIGPDVAYDFVDKLYKYEVETLGCDVSSVKEEYKYYLEYISKISLTSK